MDSGLDRYDPEITGTMLLKQNYRKYLLWLLPVLFLGLFFFYPLAAAFQLIFSSWGLSGIDFQTLNRVLEPLGFTFFQAVLSTVLTFVIGLPLAYVFGKYTFWGKSIWKASVTIPFILPTVVAASAFNAVIGPRGWLNLALMNMFSLQTPPIAVMNTLPAILIAHVFYNTSIVLRIVGTAVEQLDPRLEQSASTLGASPFRVLKEIVLPMILPQIGGAALLVFLFNFTSFGVILLMGGPQFATLEVEIYRQAVNMLNFPYAAMLTIVQMVITFLVMLFQNRVQKESVPFLPSFKEKSMSRPRGVYQKLIVFITIFVVVLLFVLPLFSLGFRSVVKLDADRGERGTIETGFTLRYYQEIFINRRSSLFYVPPVQAVVNSLAFSGISVIISLLIGGFASYALVNSSRWQRILDPVMMLPLGASAVTLGFGFLLVFSGTLLDTTGFPVLIPFAYSLVALPFVIRILQPVIASIPQNLKEAASTLGASRLRVWFEIELPLIFPALLVSLVFAFAVSFGEFGATMFLARPEYPTITVAIYRYLSQPGALNYGQAMAMATILMLVCGTSMIIIEKISRKRDW